MKIAFLDRDGVINEDFGYVSEVSQFVFRRGIFDFCRFLNELGYEIAIVTNQSGIAKNMYSEADFTYLTNYMVREFFSRGISILDICHCPHRSSDNCDCRKPMPGMIDKLLNKYKVSPYDCILIGDKLSDVKAAKAANIVTSFLMTSSKQKPEIQGSAEDFKKIEASLTLKELN